MGKANGDAGTSAYQEGAKNLAQAAQLGALFFAQDTATANRMIGDQTTLANQSLQPLSGTATVAITELRRMMGLAPEDPMLKMQNTVNYWAQHYNTRGDIPTQDRKMWVDLQSSFDTMHNAKTQDQREAARTQLLNQMDATMAKFSGPIGISSEWVASGRAGATTSTQAGGTTQDVNTERAGGTVPDQLGALYQPGYFSYSVGQLKTARDQIANMDMSEASVHPVAQTGQQIADEFMNSPNFQVAMKAGTQAADRAAAANKTRFSGNQLVSLQQLGQDTASSLYNNQISQLMSLAGMTTPGITQTAGNQFNQGQLQGANMMAQAASGQQAQNIIGQGYQTAYNKIGDARNAASIANAQMGMQGAQMGLGLLGKLF